MQILVVTRPLEGGGFEARSGEPFPMLTTGDTREAAIRSLEAGIRGRLSPGTVADVIEIPAEAPKPRSWENPDFRLDPNEPLTQEWLRAMDEARRRADAADGTDAAA